MDGWLVDKAARVCADKPAAASTAVLRSPTNAVQRIKGAGSLAWLTCCSTGSYACAGMESTSSENSDTEAARRATGGQREQSVTDRSVEGGRVANALHQARVDGAQPRLVAGRLQPCITTSSEGVCCEPLTAEADGQQSAAHGSPLLQLSGRRRQRNGGPARWAVQQQQRNVIVQREIKRPAQAHARDSRQSLAALGRQHHRLCWRLQLVFGAAELQLTCAPRLQ